MGGLYKIATDEMWEGVYDGVLHAYLSRNHSHKGVYFELS